MRFQNRTDLILLGPPSNFGRLLPTESFACMTERPSVPGAARERAVGERENPVRKTTPLWADLRFGKALQPYPCQAVGAQLQAYSIGVALPSRQGA